MVRRVDARAVLFIAMENDSFFGSAMYPSRRKRESNRMSVRHGRSYQQRLTYYGMDE